MTARSLDLRRQRILEAAARLVAADGPSSASISNIARDAGVGRKTLYGLFKGKDDCLQELARETGWHAVYNVEAAAASEGDFEVRFRAGLDAFLSFAAEHPERTKAFLFYGPAIAPDAVEEVRQRFVALLGSQPDARGDLLVGAIEYMLYRHFRDGGESPRDLLEPLMPLMASGFSCLAEEKP